MLEIRHLAVRYGLHLALQDIELQVSPGEIVVILGSNGAGKSTLLKAIGRLQPTQAGSQARLHGQDLLQLPAQAVVEAGLALVPEGRGIFGPLSVRDNLQLGANPRRARPNQTRNLRQVLDLFPRLAERLGQAASSLSGGEQQMLAVGRALMSQPDILLLDEPCLGLSPLLRQQLLQTLQQIGRLGTGLLLVEQNAAQSLAIADRGYLLENGRIVDQGSASELLLSPRVRQAYLGQ